MKFRKRKKTEYLYVKRVNTEGMSVESLRRQARRVGKLDVDFHYLVQANGDIETGRDFEVIAGYELANAEESIYIFVDIGNAAKPSDAQKVPLQNLIRKILQENDSIDLKA